MKLKSAFVLAVTLFGATSRQALAVTNAVRRLTRDGVGQGLQTQLRHILPSIEQPAIVADYLNEQIRSDHPREQSVAAYALANVFVAGGHAGRYSQTVNFLNYHLDTPELVTLHQALQDAQSYRGSLQRLLETAYKSTALNGRELALVLDALFLGEENKRFNGVAHPLPEPHDSIHFVSMSQAVVNLPELNRAFNSGKFGQSRAQAIENLITAKNDEEAKTRKLIVAIFTDPYAYTYLWEYLRQSEYFLGLGDREGLKTLGRLKDLIYRGKRALHLGIEL